ncbi:MAG: hypothetical protein AAFR51_09830 [Pseudomonadota bacterium]
MNMKHLVSLIGTLILPIAATAQGNLSGLGDVRLGIGLISSASEVEVVDSEVDFPIGDLPVSDVEVKLIDQIQLNQNGIELNGVYSPVPFLEFSGNIGYSNTDSDVTLSVAGTLDQDALDIPDFISDLIGDTFETETTTSQSTDTFRYGFGTALRAPIARIGNNPLVVRVGAQANFSEGSATDSETYVGSITLIHPTDAFGPNMTIAVGASYLDYTRFVEFTQEFDGELATISLEQEIEEPWSLTGSLIIPASENVSWSLGTAQNFDGTSAYSVRLTRRF